MKTHTDITAYFTEIGFEFEKRGDDVWVGRLDENDPPMVVAYAPPLLILQISLVPLSKLNPSEELYKKLLIANATEMDHGAFAIDEDAIIVVDTLQLENLDVNELKASIDSLNLAASLSYNLLADYRKK
ncbi:MAG: hypothetical protein D6675_16435 [Gemmatimonadetes bacterium]|nr:MAG: hypothetical protein D6675_16435 [Gemmatimonadota bacterium]